MADDLKNPTSSEPKEETLKIVETSPNNKFLWPALMLALFALIIISVYFNLSGIKDVLMAAKSAYEKIITLSDKTNFAASINDAPIFNKEALSDVPTPSSVVVPPKQIIKNIFISEALINPHKNDKGNEFIELYNNNDAQIDLKKWSLKLFKNGDASGVNLITIGGSSKDKTSIEAKGFLLIGFNSYSANPSPDATRSIAIPNGDAVIMLINSEGQTIDQMIYNESVAEGSSINRVSWIKADFIENPTPTPINSKNDINNNSNL